MCVACQPGHVERQQGDEPGVAGERDPCGALEGSAICHRWELTAALCRSEGVRTKDTEVVSEQADRVDVESGLHAGPCVPTAMSVRHARNATSGPTGTNSTRSGSIALA